MYPPFGGYRKQAIAQTLVNQAFHFLNLTGLGMIDALSLSLSLSLSQNFAKPLTLAYLPKVIRKNSALARTACSGKRLEIDYSGVIGRSEFFHIDRQLVAHRQRHQVTFERLDKAILIPYSFDVDVQAWPAGTPPSVVIVRPDQLDLEDAFCTCLARKGVIRMAFLNSQLAMALALVAHLAKCPRLHG